MPKRRYINARYYLDRIYAQQRAITDQFTALAERYALLEDRAEVLIAYDWQSRNNWPLLAEGEAHA